MLFNSYIFVFLFFPVCLLGYYGLLRVRQDKAAKIFLTIMSFWFYGYFNLSYLLIMAGSILVNYLFHRLLSGRQDKRLVILSVACNLGILFYFKYVDFFLGTINSIFGTSLLMREILLPLGISFFTFQQISFVVDTYRGEIRDCGLTEYALFVSFFPQLIAGPIVNHSEMLPQFRAIGKRPVMWEKISEGMGLFILGLAKKVLIADTFGAGVDYGYAEIAGIGRLDAALVIVFYTLQLYFDFSGYCDMARGLGKMLGIEIPVNFNSPYKATNIIDFWKRWHITLNRFFMKYVYIPLGGNRKGEARTYCNLLAVFLLSGLWHGAGWNYIVWGALHGLLYAATRFWQKRLARRQTAVTRDASERKTPLSDQEECTRKAVRQSGIRHVRDIVITWVSRIMLFIYVSVAWVYFRAESIGQANQMLLTAVKGPWKRVSMDLAECFRLDEFWYVIKVLRLDQLAYSRYILMAVILAAGVYLAMGGANAAQRVERMKYKPVSAVFYAVLMIWCVLTFSEVSTFLYFNF
ncbi:MAG: MBOAT family protein [Lachnospiraceae bacterium]|nr:MBOAT family protein [Lachnospiraceae bacterium]